MKQLKRIFVLSVLITIVGISASLTLKVAIGVGAYDALAQSISFLSGIKVGTIGMILNCSCVLGQWILLRKNFTLRHLLQVPMSILIGVVINLFLYDILSSIIIESYIIKLVILVIALTILSSVIGAVMVLDLVTFPFEGFCMALAKRTKLKFVTIRQSGDFLSILLVVLLTFGFSLPLTIREGTIIAMLMLAPLMGFFMKRIRPIFREFNLIDEEVDTEDLVKQLKTETL